jgi:CheY-like chemotaxis protein/signal transduction histidine kinase
MSETVIPAGAWMRVRRWHKAARSGAAQHPASLASICAFALLGAPATGIVVSALIALSRSHTANAAALRRARSVEEQFDQLRSAVARQHAQIEKMRTEAQRRCASAALERARVAERTRRIACDPAQAIFEMLNEADVDAATPGLPFAATPVARVVRSALATFALAVRDGLDPAPLDTRAIVLDETPVDLRDVIDGTVVLLAPRAVAKGVELRVSIDRSVAASVLADRERVGQIVFHMLAAAIESVGAGRLTIAACSETLNAGAQRVFIGVSGEGRASTTPSGAQVSVNDVDSAGDNPTVNLRVSDDPDLALCRVLAQRMGGDIEVGHGATFGVCVAFHAPFTVERLARLPAERGRRTAVVDLAARDERVALCDLLDRLGVEVVPVGMPAPEHADFWFADENASLSEPPRADRFIRVSQAFVPGGLREISGRFTLSVNPLSWSAVQRVCALRSANHGARVRRPRATASVPVAAAAPRLVLVVDDNEINRRVVARQLDVLGYRSMVAPGVDDALAAMMRQCFDLVITDLHMPGASGVELARHIRVKNRESSSTIPVVLMTGERAETAGSAESADTIVGFDVPHALFAAVLPKPAGLDALDACLRRIFTEPLGQAPSALSNPPGHKKSPASLGF